MKNTIKAAEAVNARMSEGFDPSLIIVIIGVIVDAVKLWRNCKDESPTQAVRNRHVFFRTRIRRAATVRLHEGELALSAAPDMAHAVMEVLSGMSDDEVKEIAEEIKS